jgi:F-type H+-transporting ATPase subunit epsilon
VSGLTLQLNSAARSQRIEGVASFVGADASGSFGIQPGRARFMTVLEYGLARFCDAGGVWQYLACPGAILHHRDNELVINTRRYLLDTDFARISAQLAGQLAQEDAELQGIKDKLQRLEQELFRRLRQMDSWETRAP